MLCNAYNLGINFELDTNAFTHNAAFKKYEMVIHNEITSSIS